MESRRISVLYRGRRCTLEVGPYGIDFDDVQIPWHAIHFVDVPEPGMMTITVIRPDGEHHDLHFNAALVPLTADGFAELARPFR